MGSVLVSLVGLALVMMACTGPVGPGGQDTESGASPASSFDAAESGLRVSTASWSTDFMKHEVPLGEIISGGPGKDGIPAIDEPSSCLSIASIGSSTANR